jgi:aminomethyltransferase
VTHAENAALKTTPLNDLHASLGAKMVPFAGYAMPVQYTLGILKEHLHTRAAVGLFDVSHMGQVALRGDGVAAALEVLVPGDIQGLAPGRMRYTMFTNDQGGILDDLIVTNAGDHHAVVVNAACKTEDIAHLRAGLPGGIEVEVLDDLALIALQGPQAAAVLQRHTDTKLDAMPFMTAAQAALCGVSCGLTRSGYTGEDGFEISVASDQAAALATALLDEPEVEAIGLGARDSLRLEAGLCLYGHDIDTTTTPVEAALTWSIGKRRREEGGFPGDAIVQRQLRDGVERVRVGLRPEDRTPAREGARLTDENGTDIGVVTSGGFGPTVGGPVAMGYVQAKFREIGTTVTAIVRDRPLKERVTKMPFVPANYYRG